MREATVRHMIARDTVPVTLTRTGRVRTGGGFAPLTPVTLGPYTALIAERGGAFPRETVTVAGGRTVDNGWAALTGPEIDLFVGKIGDEVEERLSAPHGTFRVRDKRPIRHGGAITGYQFGLEKVAG